MVFAYEVRGEQIGSCMSLDPHTRSGACPFCGLVGPHENDGICPQYRLRPDWSGRVVLAG